MATAQKEETLTFNTVLDKVENLLSTFGYSKDPSVFQQIKDISFYHKFRRKLYTSSILNTVADINEVFSKVEKKHQFLNIGFWLVFPVLISIRKFDEVKNNFEKAIIDYNRDVYEFRPYTAKCTFHVTIWPKIELHSFPSGYLFLVAENGITRKDIDNLTNRWKAIPGFDKFGVLPPLIVDLKNHEIVSPFTKTKLTKYPPSIKELHNAIFENN